MLPGFQNSFTATSPVVTRYRRKTKDKEASFTGELGNGLTGRGSSTGGGPPPSPPSSPIRRGHILREGDVRMEDALGYVGNDPISTNVDELCDIEMGGSEALGSPLIEEIENVEALNQRETVSTFFPNLPSELTQVIVASTDFYSFYVAFRVVDHPRPCESAVARDLNTFILGNISFIHRASARSACLEFCQYQYHYRHCI
jgi:hypothetical protein